MVRWTGAGAKGEVPAERRPRRPDGGAGLLLRARLRFFGRRLMELQGVGRDYRLGPLAAGRQGGYQKEAEGLCRHGRGLGLCGHCGQYARNQGDGTTQNAGRSIVYRVMKSSDERTV